MSYIERDEAIRAAASATHDQITAVDVASALEELPTADVVEVVRCKDCRHFDLSLTGTPVCTIEERSPIMVSRQHYCSYGERKEE